MHRAGFLFGFERCACRDRACAPIAARATRQRHVYARHLPSAFVLERSPSSDIVAGQENRTMRKGDVICPECNAGFRRIELDSRRGHAGEFHCPLCNRVLEVFDGTTEIAYRLTVAPEKLFE